MRYSLIRFFRNLKYLMKYSLKEDKENLKVNILSSVEDVYFYRILNYTDDIRNKVLKVLDHEKTLSLLLEHPKSFCRFGDGELEICMGNGIPFQKYEPRLQKILLQILQNNTENMYVGIDYNYFSPIYNFTETVKSFQILHTSKYRDFLTRICCKSRVYIASGFTILYLIYKEYDYDNYYNRIKELFRNKELIIIAGEGVLDKLKYNVFELAKSREHIVTSSVNAFSEFDNLLQLAYEYPPNKKIFVFILGPTANALVYKLSQKGYIAWDIGHLAKDYDAYMKKIEKNEKNIFEFFKPD